MNNLPATRLSPEAEKFLAKKTARARVIFAVDATASRQFTWDRAAQLQAEMFKAAAAAGNLEIQLVYYRGHHECTASQWLTSGAALAAAMSKVDCRAGPTQIGRVLAHARRENARQKVGALILVSDACEEIPADLLMVATELGAVPCFMFQENENASVKQTFSAVAEVTKGGWAQFDNSSAQRLGELLRGVAAYAAGGLPALAKEGTAGAALLLSQLKGGGA
jgi:hypothetical protein